MPYYHRVISEKNVYDLNGCNNVRDILYNNDDINHIVKLIVHSPVGKLIYIKKKNMSNIISKWTDIE